MKTPYEGLPVHGYQPQTGDNVAKVNRMKVLEERLLRELDQLATEEATDKRWLAIGRTGIEQAFMAINRSVFKPIRTALPEDFEEVGQ